MRLLEPDLLVRHVAEIPPGWLAERGVRAVVSDLDNTLVGWHSEAVTDDVARWIASLHDAGIQVCVASNTMNLRRLERVCAALGILHVPANAGKPGTRGLQQALALLETPVAHAAMVGDQLFTDIVAGNRLGLTTVLVNPLTPREFVGTRWISRNAERLVLRGEKARPR